MKKILFIHQSADWYGSDKVLFVVATGLRDSGYAVNVVLPHSGILADKFASVGINVLFAPIVKIERASMSLRGGFSLLLSAMQFYKFIFSLAKDAHYDAVYSNTLATFAGCIASSVLKVKHIWHVHEIVQKPAIAEKIFIAALLRYADFIIANSNSTKKWLTDCNPALGQKSVVIHNGVDSLAKPSQFKSSNSCNLVVALVGRLNLIKGHKLLIDAMKKIVNDLPADLVVEFVGDSFAGQEYMAEDIKAYAAESGLADRIRFIGFVENIADYWPNVHIAVVPTTIPESFGMVAIEAMRESIPVVAANHGGLAEVVVNNETGYLFEPNNVDDLASKLLKLILDKTLRESFGNAGFIRQQALFSTIAQVNKTVKVIESL